MLEPLYGNEIPRMFLESRLTRRLSTLSARGRSALALCCAWRLFPAYLKWHDEVGTEPDRRVGELLALLSLQLRRPTEEVQANEMMDDINGLLDLMPTEDSAWSPSRPIAEDAVACLAYTLRSIKNDHPQEAAWAARRAYEAADQLAIFDLEQGELEVPQESSLQAHPAVQKELERQARDYASISQGDFVSAIVSAQTSSILDH